MNNEIMKSDNLLSQVDNSLFGSTSNTTKIITRGAEEGLLEFKTITQENLEKIANLMPEINRATNSFGKTQSQFMNYIMTVSKHSAYRNLRQILAEIERRRMALKENTFKTKKSMVELLECREKFNKLEDIDENKYKRLRLQIRIEELESNIADSRLYIEGALKTILGYQLAYQDIMKTHNIPADWDEKSFEDAEEEHHIKTAFLQAHADILSTGRIGQGNHEYLWQCGINPGSAFEDIQRYIMWEKDNYVKSSGKIGVLENIPESEPKLEIDSFIDWLESMYQKYKGGSRKMLEKRGIKLEGYYDEAVYRDLGKTTGI